MSKLTFEDGMWCIIEFLIDFDDGCARESVREHHISREQAIKLANNSGAKPNVIKDLDEMGTWG